MAVHGSSAFLEQPARWGWRQNGGAYKERTWEGPAASLTSFLSASLPQGYSEYSVEDQGDLVIVRAIYTADIPERIGNPSDDGLLDRSWELEGDDLETSLWAHPSVIAETANQTIAQAIALRTAVDAALAGETTWTSLGGAIDNLVNRLAKGTESFFQSTFVLRKVETVRKNSSIRPSFTNVNRVFSYAALLSSEPSLAYENLIQASGLQGLSWLKCTPRVRPTQDGLWEISQEYKGAQTIDSWIYPNAS